jgi:uncharacterized protein YjbI with pentapeptide repeats
MSKTFIYEHTSLAGARFTDVNLSDAWFDNVNLHNARFTNVRLEGATFNGINFTNASIEHANLEGMRINGILVSELLEAYRQRSSGGGEGA